jgi:mRNA interferase MazF
VAKFIKGDVLVVPFPFSDLTNAKRRPAFVLAALPGDDVILCQITSRDVKDEMAIKLKVIDFETGSLPVDSNIRPNRLFTADRHIILYKVGHLKQEKIEQVVNQTIDIIRS